MNVYPYPEHGPPRWTDPKADAKVDLALSAANTPGAALQESVRPPLAQIQVFPPRYGYTPYAGRQVRIDEVVQQPRVTQDRRLSWTGTQGGYSGTSRPSNEQS